jgi:hypothetical protein
MKTALQSATLALLVGVMVATTGAVSAQANDFARDFFQSQMLERD